MSVQPLTRSDVQPPRAVALLDPSSPNPHVCDVRVELGDLVSDEDVRADLAADPAHWLLEFGPRVGTTDTGRAVVGMTVPGPDVWTSVLTAMAVLRRSGYDLHALHVESRGPEEDRPAA